MTSLEEQKKEEASCAPSLHRILQDGHAAPREHTADGERVEATTPACRTATLHLGSPTADGERSKILLFKQQQQQVARFANSTCPATPGHAHQLRGTCTLDPGRASGGVTESEDVPVGAEHVL